MKQLGEIVDRGTALKQGYRPLTTPYTKQEIPWLLRVVADLKRDPSIKYCLVQSDLLKEEFEVYRQGMVYL